MRENEKIYKIEKLDKEVIIKKMEAMEGIAILKELLTKALPIDLIGSLKDAGIENQTLEMVMSGMSKDEMSTDDFMKLQRRLLKNVYCIFPTGEVQLIDKFGNYKIEGVQYDMFVVALLLKEVVLFNYKDFFVDILQELEKTGILNKIPLMQED